MSLAKPTMVGPNPDPMMMVPSDIRADAAARMRGGAMVWTEATTGPE